MTPTKAIIAGLFVVAGAMPATAEILLGASISATGPAGALGDPEAKTLEMLVEEFGEGLLPRYPTEANVLVQQGTAATAEPRVLL